MGLATLLGFELPVGCLLTWALQSSSSSGHRRGCGRPASWATPSRCIPISSPRVRQGSVELSNATVELGRTHAFGASRIGDGLPISNKPPCWKHFADYRLRHYAVGFGEMVESSLWAGRRHSSRVLLDTVNPTVGIAPTVTFGVNTARYKLPTVIPTVIDAWRDNFG